MLNATGTCVRRDGAAWTAIVLLACVMFGGTRSAHAQGCTGASGNCYEAHATPGCSHVSCCNAVCAVDPFCCSDMWDSFCVGTALTVCTTCGEPGAGSCYESHVGNGCESLSCCDFVCEEDPFCCNNTWDQLCADRAIVLCSACGNPGSGNCFAPNGTLGCELEWCCETVCFQDAYCCESVWDTLCASIALSVCTSCGSQSAGSCFAQHGSPSCNNGVCCEVICQVDPYCCSTAWDGICVAAAVNLCATCGGPGSGSCLISDETPACDDGTCCEEICLLDPYCCETRWDQLCVRQAMFTCYHIGHPDSGDCYSENVVPGCNSLSCAEEVCAADPFCCEFAWDSICVSAATAMCCPQDCVASDTFTYPNDGVVNGADLAVLIGMWGACRGCCADSVTSATLLPPPDGIVDGADLAVLLGAWGAPGCTF